MSTVVSVAPSRSTNRGCELKPYSTKSSSPSAPSSNTSARDENESCTMVEPSKHRAGSPAHTGPARQSLVHADAAPSSHSSPSRGCSAPSPQNSVTHSGEQPSPDSWLPSSHCSPAWNCTMKSPQRSSKQLCEHPSPSIALPSSHCSKPSSSPLPQRVNRQNTHSRPSSGSGASHCSPNTVVTMPSPQNSKRQRREHPSPSRPLPSSHSSPRSKSTTRSPQPAGWGPHGSSWQPSSPSSTSRAHSPDSAQFGSSQSTRPSPSSSASLAHCAACSVATQAAAHATTRSAVAREQALRMGRPPLCSFAMTRPDAQLGFSLPGDAPRVPPAPVDDELRAVAAALPARVRLGTSSWSFPGWRGLVWERTHDEGTLARHGLPAYAAHPLFRTVSLDRGHYAPIPVEQLRAYADGVPPTFRFVVKAHDLISLAVVPNHPRYGALRGGPGPRFLDAAYATDVVVRPTMAGLGERLGVLLFQLAAQPVDALGGPLAFAERVHAFLRALPRGPVYAVEVRNAPLQTPALLAALEDAGAVPCLAAIDGMPPLPDQVAALGGTGRRALVVRWLLRRGLTYEAAYDRYAPFSRVVDVDDRTRDDVAELVRAADDATPAFVIVNNKAEGSAPLTVARLARRLVA
jgi:uncharacterized protein YecE (DUF72 family)